MPTTNTAAGLGIDNRRLKFNSDYMNRRVHKQIFGWDAGNGTWALTPSQHWGTHGHNHIDTPIIKKWLSPPDCGYGGVEVNVFRYDPGLLSDASAG